MSDAITYLPANTDHYLFKDLTGKRFGHLVVIHLLGRHRRLLFWHCQCDCGKESAVVGAKLNSGHTRSCGCVNGKPRPQKKPKGLVIKNASDHPLFAIWVNMRQRCQNPNNPAYESYGGRGIKVCDRWANSFYNFVSDMGERPFGKSLDRKDNNKGYGPDNCRWATAIEQAENTRATVKLIHDGEELSIKACAEKLGLKAGTIRYRLKKGLPLDKVLDPNGFRDDEVVLEYKGVRKNMKDWSRVMGINYATLQSRLERGWSIDRALTTRR